MVTLHPSNASGFSLGRTPLVAALLCAGLFMAAPAHAVFVGIIVNSAADTTGNASICTLRDAITAANTNVAVGGCSSGAPGLDSILFNIPGPGVHTIVLTSNLPTISEPININGYSQPGSVANSIAYAYPAGGALDAQIMIEIDGNGLGGGVGSHMFYIPTSVNNNTITGLSVGNHGGNAPFGMYGQANFIGNFLGMRADGITPFLNASGGVIVGAMAGGSVIGSTGSPAQRNLILGGVGVFASGVIVSGNLLGTDKTGMTKVVSSPGSAGIVMNAPGTGNILTDNVIAMNGVGIWLNGVDNIGVANNLIGVGVGGVALGNTVGVRINNINGAGAAGNTIAGNTIANSTGDGIRVWDATGLGAISGNSLDLNSLYGSGGLGINLEGALDAPSSVTPNDVTDTDTGPNDLQNFPLITSAKANAGGGIDIAFTLNSSPNGLFRVTAYANPVCHASGHGEGRYDSGTQTAVVTDASGSGVGTLTVPAPLPTGWGVGQVVALLARDNATHDTSEFSACATVTPFVGGNQPPLAVNDTYATPINTALNVAANGVLANDSDPDGNAITAVLSVSTTHGTLALNANGGFVYTPTAGYSGPDSFTYFANDGTVNSISAATVSITVTAVANTPPVATNDSYSVMTGNTPNLTVSAPGVLANDSDPDGNAITAVLNAGPAHGTLMLNANGGFVYTPTPGYSGPDSFTYYAFDGMANSTSAATVSIAVSAVVITPPDTTPPIVALTIPASCGLGSMPAIVNLSLEEGPAFAADMVGILSNALGQAMVYLEQGACGTVTLGGFNAGKLAFIPHTFQTEDPRANGIYPMGNGQYQVVRNSQSLMIAPALVHLEQITALLPGVAAKQVDNGVMTASVNGLTYVVQARAPVQLEAPTGAAQLQKGGDGYFHFIDALGHNQALYPAFADPTTLRSVLLGLDPAATLTIELDGTASIVLNGQHYTLVADLTLGDIPAERVGLYWWQESATRYRVINAQMLGTSQGFTVRP